MSKSTQPGDWTYGNMYASPPRFHRCNRCGAERAHMDLHDEWHEHIEASA